MIKTILFIIVIAIIAYFIYRSFNETKLKGGVELSDNDIWGTVDYVIKNGNIGDSEYIPSNYHKFPDKYKRYLMFEYAKGINAYHKKYEYIIKFDNVDNVSNDYGYEAYKYTNNNVELTILASENNNGDIESCYKLIVKCDDFTDTDSNASYRQPLNSMYRPLSTQNVMDNDYETRANSVRENLNNSNSDIGPRIPIVTDENSGSLGDSTESNNSQTTKLPIITPYSGTLQTGNENINLNNNNDNENTQEAENNKTIYEGESNIAQREEQEEETNIGNQTTEQTSINGEQEEENELIKVFQRAAKYMNDNRDNVCPLNSIIVLNGFNTNKLSETLKKQDFVYQIFDKFNNKNKYSLVYSELDGWTIQLSNSH